MLTTILLFFQDMPSDTASAITDPDAPKEVGFSILDMIIKGGPIGIAIVSILLLLSGLAVYIFFERLMTIRRAGKVDQNFMERIRKNVQEGNIDAAKALCESENTPVARMVSKGLQRIGKPLKDIDASVENVGNLEIYKLEKNLSTLATVSGAAPMIGFFGTVTGMILAFYEMANASSVDPQLLAGGIYQALLTTAFGLLVGIVAFVGYNLLISRVDRVVFKMEAATVEFLDLLQEPA